MTRAEKHLAVLSCEGCGACCIHMGHPTFAGNPPKDKTKLSSPETWHSLRKDHRRHQHLPDPLKGELDKYLDSLDGEDYGLPCVWLDVNTKRCRHYEYRPMVCRQFKLGGEDCVRIRNNNRGMFEANNAPEDPACRTIGNGHDY
jgi:Fe-S-cluster containining protein